MYAHLAVGYLSSFEGSRQMPETPSPEGLNRDPSLNNDSKPMKSCLQVSVQVGILRSRRVPGSIRWK